MIGFALALSAAATGEILFASGGWTAIDRGARCEALSRELQPPPKGQAASVAGVVFSADRAHWGQFTLRLGRPVRAGSSILVDIGAQSFLLDARGQEARSRDGAQDQAIIEALRSAAPMTITARDSSGRRMRDRFDTRGAATAIDAAAARCAGKSR